MEKGCKANVARLKIYTKRAGEDETSGPTDEGTNSDGSGESKPRRLKPDPKRGGAPEPKTLPPPKRNVSFCLIVTFKPYCDNFTFTGV